MDKKPLIGVSICAVVLLVLGSLSNVVGYPINQISYSTKIINDSILNFKKNIYVDDSNVQGPWDGTIEHPYQYIKDGVKSARFGDSVYVLNGTYNEGVIYINRTISVIGENKNTTFIISGSSDCFIINSDFTKICNFSLSSYGNAYFTVVGNYDVILNNIMGHPVTFRSHYGIFIKEMSHSIIEDNQIYKTACAIHFDMFSSSKIRKHNKIYNNYINDAFTGLDFYHANFNHISQNTIINTDHEIYFYDSYFNILTNNNFLDQNPYVLVHTLIIPPITYWNGNYWGEPLVLPKPISGTIYGFSLFPAPPGPGKDWINYDYHPRLEPNLYLK